LKLAGPIVTFVFVAAVTHGDVVAIAVGMVLALVVFGLIPIDCEQRQELERRKGGPASPRRRSHRAALNYSIPDNLQSTQDWLRPPAEVRRGLGR
jgi:hypothetical protein